MTVDAVQEWLSSHPTSLVIAGGVLGVVLVLVLVVLVMRALRGRDLNAKASVGFAAVQAGVAYITITGVYEWFRRVLDMPAIEAGLLAAFIEACTWAAVGFVYTHGKSTDDAGHRNEGFGPAGPFFWVTVCGGGLLAILGSASSSVAIGRIVVVVLGAYMWYLRLLQVTTRTKAPTQWRWTPRALLIAVGALTPGETDVKDEHHEWQVRQLARAIRWSNSRWPFSWLGGRALVRRGETTSEDVLNEARRRWAAAHVLRADVSPTSPAMATLLASVRRGQRGDDIEAAHAAQLQRLRDEHADQVRVLHGQLADLGAQLDAARSSAEGRDADVQLRDQLRQLSQQVTAAASVADAERDRTGRLEADLEAARAELAQTRVLVTEPRTEPGAVENQRQPMSSTPRPRGSKEAGVAAILAALRAGEEIDKRALAEEYGTTLRTINRWMDDAQTMLAEHADDDRPTLSVVGRS